MIVIGASVLILCSCRGMPRDEMAVGQGSEAALPAADSCPPQGISAGTTLPPTAWTGAPAATIVPGDWARDGIIAPWAPPGIARPWPKDEYIADGGDHGAPTYVRDNWSIHGLEPEDTIAHFDTLDGRTLITPSNRVELYAPKFAAVRKVTFVETYMQDRDRTLSLHRPRPPITAVEREEAGAVLQPVAPEGEIGRKQLTVQQRNVPPLWIDEELRAAELANRLKAYENLSIIRIGVFDEAQKAVLAERIEAAIVWTADQGAQVVLDGKLASVAIGDRRAQATYTYDSDTSPRLRIIKIASTDAALPGKIVEFTLRYDNTGTELIGNVTIVDNLTTRLEYVPESAKSDRDARFSTEANDAGSLVLRWELAEPLEPGQGGLLRFKCRVR